MQKLPIQVKDQVILEREHFQILLDTLIKRGYQIIGPTLGEGSIIYSKLSNVSDLPIGWTDEQDGGMYRLKKRDDNALFGYVVGPHSWKNFLFPSVQNLWQAKRNGNSFQIIEKDEAVPKFAFLGARSCDIYAISIQDKVFIKGKFVDPQYKSRREDAFIAAINCGKAGGTCFCVSMGTGPKADLGFDIAMTEILENHRHCFLVEIETERGAEVFQEIPCRKATEEEKNTAHNIIRNTAKHMGRFLDTHNIKDILYRNYEHPRWDDVAQRCLACANCTLVCPTCFCATVEDATDVSGEHAERWRKLDSCFNLDHSYIHGGNTRYSIRSRYRQWLIHKIATWIDQFGTTGCVGCGRCITWCPVAIDITEEARAIRESDQATRQSP
jgi:formate hydrogenlyase subunit 6/NADH:ubiquinone oxidoreductase subunit I